MTLVQFENTADVIEYVNPDMIVYGNDHGDHYSLHLDDRTVVHVKKTDQNAQILFTGGTL